jgi:hypothetical protein
MLTMAKAKTKWPKTMLQRVENACKKIADQSPRGTWHNVADEDLSMYLSLVEHVRPTEHVLYGLMNESEFIELRLHGKAWHWRWIYPVGRPTKLPPGTKPVQMRLTPDEAVAVKKFVQEFRAK